MTYASTSIDRRAAYYAKAAEHIAADPLLFYTRAEKGRRFIAGWLHAAKPEPVVVPDNILHLPKRSPPTRAA